MQIAAGTDNDVPIILPVDGTTTDNPRISNITFNTIADQVFQMSMQVDDPDANLGPQMLAIDTKRFKSYRLVPKDGDIKDKKTDFPNGEYLSPFIPVALDGENLGEWLFAVADHKCSNGVIYDGTGQSVFNPAVAHAETLNCNIPRISKSNFDKIYRFFQTKPGVLAGEQIAGDLIFTRFP